MYRHWWYRGRRVVTRWLIRRAGAPLGGLVLDFGCGTGHMGPVLAQFGEVTGVDSDPAAFDVGRYKDYSRVVVASDLDDPAFPDGPFALIALLDVLEHVENDQALLAGLARHLAPSGQIVASVPLWPELFCEADRLAGHYRRYTPSSFLQLARSSGLEVVASTGYVVALLPIARLQRRRVIAGAAGATEEFRVPWAPVNAVLSAVAMIEGWLGGVIGLRPGLSLVAVLRPSSMS